MTPVTKTFGRLFAGMAVFGIFLDTGFGAAREVHVGIYENPPMIFVRGGKPQGLFSDLLQHVAAAEGWNVRYTAGSWGQCLARLRTGSIDLVPNIAYQEHRRRICDFSETTVLVTWSTVYVQPSSEIERVPDLAGRTVAVISEDVSAESLKDLCERFGVTCRFLELADFASVMDSVHTGTADAGLVSRFFGLQHEKDYQVRESPIVCAPVELRFAVPRGRNRDLLEALDKHMSELRKDKRSVYYRSLKKWVQPIEPLTLPDWVGWTLGIVATLAALFAGTGITLRAQVRKQTAELRAANTQLQAEMAERSRARQRLLAYQEELRELALKLSLAEEAERKRLATDLHDSVIQALSLSRIKLGTLEDMLTGEASGKTLAEVRDIFNNALLQLRTLTFELSPPILYELGLGAALEWLGDQLKKDGIAVKTAIEPEPRVLDRVIRVLLFQSVRELLVNISKHAKANTVELAMACDDGSVTVSVNDDGTGFDSESLAGRVHDQKSFGLFSIRERIRQIGGSLEICSVRGKGTHITLRAPCSPGENAETGEPPAA